jgi:glycosyltransferase involved in cell wall biosynthesis
LRILHVVATYLPAVRYGGTIVSVHGLARALSARGHDVHVFTTSVDGPRDSAVPHGTPVNIDGVSVWYFKSPRYRRIYWSPDLAAMLRTRISSFDVIHTHAIYLWPMWAAARAARRANLPYVVSPRGMLERELIARKSPMMKGLWIAAIERGNLERASAIHVTSARELEEAAAFGFNLPPAFEIPNGVDLETPAPGENPSPAVSAILGRGPFVLFLGRINWKKGLDRLIAAMSSVRGADLVVAGNDEEGYQHALEGIAERAGVAGRVMFAGSVNGADKAALLAGARLLVLPSYSENFGNVVLEAMGARCPVIVTPEVGIANIVSETAAGWVIDGEPGTLGAAITRLLDDPGLRREMGERGMTAARDRFSWDAVAARMESVYESIARPGNPAA